MMRQPIRAVGIVIKEQHILLMHRRQDGKEFYVFPGGGVEDEETGEQTVIRELQEETCIEARVVKLLYHHHITSEQGDSDQYFYLCEYLAGVPKLGGYNELESMKSGDGFYEPLWFPISKLPNTVVYPLEIRDWLLEDIKNDFTGKLKEASFKRSDLRQSA